MSHRRRFSLHPLAFPYFGCWYWTKKADVYLEDRNRVDLIFRFYRYNVTELRPRSISITTVKVCQVERNGELESEYGVPTSIYLQ